jgi:hypothetical protein
MLKNFEEVFKFTKDERLVEIDGDAVGSFIAIISTWNNGNFPQVVYYSSITQNVFYIGPYDIKLHSNVHTFYQSADSLKQIVLYRVNDRTIERRKIVEKIQDALKNFNIRSDFGLIDAQIYSNLPVNSQKMRYNYVEFKETADKIKCIEAEIKSLEKRLKQLKQCLKN